MSEAERSTEQSNLLTVESDQVGDKEESVEPEENEKVQFIICANSPPSTTRSTIPPAVLVCLYHPYIGYNIVRAHLRVLVRMLTSAAAHQCKGNLNVNSSLQRTSQVDY